jgi:Integrase core domain
MNAKEVKLLSKIYNDPANPAGFSTLDKLWKAVNKSIPKRNIKKWLESQNAYTLHRPLRKRFKRNHFTTSNIDELWQADLNDLKSLSKDNDGYVYILTVIDVFSKFAWGIPLFRKTGIEITNAFKEIFESSGRKPVHLQTDKGKEFLNTTFQSFLKKNDVGYYYTNNPDVKACIVERLNRTLKNRMWKYFTQRNTRRYVEVLPSLMSAYNNTKHSTIRMSPAEVNEDNIRLVWHNTNDKFRIKKYKQKLLLKVGDHIRISNEKMKFDKGYEQNWSDEVFLITAILKRTPIVYRIKDLHGEDIEGTFYDKEVQKVNYNPKAEFKIDKIIDTRGRGVRREVLVKWVGYPSKFNSWILASEVKKNG